MKKIILVMLLLMSQLALGSYMDRIDDCQRKGSNACIFSLMREMALKEAGNRRAALGLSFVIGTCRVEGYSDKSFVGPAKDEDDLKEMCRYTKDVNFRMKAYVDEVKTF